MVPVTGTLTDAIPSIQNGERTLDAQKFANAIEQVNFYFT